MNNQPAAVVMTAIICIAALEIVAMCFGYDGTILAGALALIGGLGGYLTGHTISAIRARKAWEAWDRRETPR